MNWIERCKEGDRVAWERLFDERAVQIYRWALLLGLAPAEAEDAAQEALATAVRRIDSLECEAAMTSWLYQITRRVVANQRRLVWWRRWFSALDDEALEAGFCHEDDKETERELDIRRCLGRLPREQAEMLLLLDVEGFTRQEAAEILAVPPGTVASRHRRAREAFREQWKVDRDSSLLGLWEKSKSNS